jgi:hypothetical protein
VRASLVLRRREADKEGGKGVLFSTYIYGSSVSKTRDNNALHLPNNSAPASANMEL